MRWKLKPDPEEYSRRTVRRFLLLPTRLRVNSDAFAPVLEWRWLERAEIVQQYTSLGREWFDIHWKEVA